MSQGVDFTGDRRQEFSLYRTCSKFAYSEDPKLNEELPDTDYKVSQVITNERGLQILVLESSDQQKPVIFCCRGTKLHRWQNIIDNLSKSIGSYSFKESKSDIEAALKTMEKRGRKVVITGHSLGGAVAQQIVAHFPKYIEAAYTFNAPGVGKRVANLFEQNKAALSVNPKIYHVRHTSDFVFHAGGAHLQATEEIKLWHDKKMSLKKSHSLPIDLEERMYSKTSGGVRFSHRVFKGIVEPLRRGVLARSTRAILKNKERAKIDPLSKRISRLAKAIFKNYILILQ